jgi:hypothetical protein
VEVTSGETTSVTVRIGGVTAPESPATSAGPAGPEPAADFGAPADAAPADGNGNGVTSQLGTGHGE